MMKKNNIFLIILVLTILLNTYIHTNNKIYIDKAVSIMNKENSKTLEKALESNEFLEEYKMNYQEIDYIEKDNFINEINRLLNLTYTPFEINEIYKYVNEENIKKILTTSKLDLQNYYNIKNFEVDKIPRYEEYEQNNNCTLEEAVLKVNIGLDHDFYSQIEEVTNTNEYTVLVNKYHSLGNYEPNDLKNLSYNENYKLREKAADAFEKLLSAAKLDNVYIRPYSAYRPFERQNTIYNSYVEKDGQEIADTYSARPGHSEHQTGLAVDVWSEGHNYITENDASWLYNNSYKYGFIIRYTKENKPITGYIEEPWHLRYLGNDLAKDVVEKNLTYDEYYDLYLK